MKSLFHQKLELALYYFKIGRLSETDVLASEALELNPKSADALHIRGIVAGLDSRHTDAEAFLRKAAEIEKNNHFIFFNLAKSLSEQGKSEASLKWHRKALELNAHHDKAWLNFGQSLLSLNKFQDAIYAFNRAIHLNKNLIEAYSNKASCLHAIGANEEAFSINNAALRLNPKLAEIWANQGLILDDLKRSEEALKSFNRAVELKPDFAEAWNNRGNTLNGLRRFEEALSSLNKALELKPDFAEAWNNRGNTLNGLRRFEEALSSLNKALELKPDFAEAWNNQGNALNSLRRFEEALSSLNKALELKSDFAEAWNNRGNLLFALKLHEEAATSYFRALELKNEGPDLGRAHHQLMLACNWKNHSMLIEKINQGVAEDRLVTEPFAYLGVSESEFLSAKCARIYCQDKFPERPRSLNRKKLQKSKLKIGYLCGEFRDHATSHLMAGVWEQHDCEKFEIFGFDSGWNDGSDYRKRVENSIPKLYEISRLSDIEVTKLVNEQGIDILVNLNGYFGNGRQEVFAHRPASISINYLGFPGTIGAPYIDYLIADKIVVPVGSSELYSEKIIYLPHCYQPNDNLKEISDRCFTRGECGLPEDAFIFVCFNNNYKITPLIFKSWMAILKAVEKSCLWLLADNGEAKNNLKAEAERLKINPERLIFAERVKSPDHLARHKLADLFLDTSPYNAHTTASDCLWAGLPFLTLRGSTFPGRVGASLLNTLNMPELISSTIDQYEKTAIFLANNPDELAKLRTELSQKRLTSPLFNTKLITQHIELAFQTAHDRFRAGLPPDHIDLNA